jgi:hypothetical protein
MQAKKRGNLFWKAVAAAAAGASVLGLTAWYRYQVTSWDRDNDTDDPDDIRSTLIRDFLPDAEFTGEVSVVVHAPPSAIFAAIHSVTLDDMPLATWLGKLRYLPARLLGKAQPEAVAKQALPFIDFLQTEAGNIVLTEIANQELILGAIGKFHNLSDQQPVQLNSARDFVEFDHPDYQKLAMSFSLVPLPEGTGSRLVLVHGTHALSDAARRKFALYWLGIKPGGNLVSWLMLDAIKSIAERSSQRSNVASLI